MVDAGVVGRGVVVIQGCGVHGGVGGGCVGPVGKYQNNLQVVRGCSTFM